MATKLRPHLEWPYNVILIALKDLTIDLRYQRPPQVVFVEKLIREFDETLVGVLDVSERKDGKHAILDGAQRYQALLKFKSTVWCAVYSGMSIAEEAMFFYNKNRNRRNVHPFYQIRALIAAGDKRSIEINRIVTDAGFKLGIGAAQDDMLQAIRGVEDAFNMSSLARKESLSPTLKIMRTAFLGRKGGKEGELLRGFGKFFQAYEDELLDWEWLIEKMSEQNPTTMLGRAYDKATNSREPRSFWLARDVAEMYNRGKPRGQRLSLVLIKKAA